MQLKFLVVLLALFPYTKAFSAGTTNYQLPTPNFVTRAEAVYRLIESDPRLAARAAWYRSHMPPLPLFHDVPQENAFAPYLEAAFEAGIIPGNRERLFHLNDPLRTDEAQAMIQHFHGERDRIQTGDVIFFVRPISRENFLALLQRESVSTTPTTTNYPLPTTHFSTPPTIPTLPIPVAPPPPPDLFAISIPTLGIERLQVSHPKDPMTHAGIIEPLKRGVGHLFGLPGEGGKVMIYGHSSGYPWDVSAYTRIFRRVNRLADGDIIALAYKGRRFAYQVTGRERVAANDLRPFQEDTDGEELILYTCWPPDSTSERLLVRARPVQNILPLPTGEG